MVAYCKRGDVCGGSTYVLEYVWITVFDSANESNLKPKSGITPHADREVQVASPPIVASCKGWQVCGACMCVECGSPCLIQQTI
jgi:hypothetical protein